MNPQPPQTRQPSSASAVGVPMMNAVELHGVPMAYRQEDGSVTPAPVIDASHRRAYYPTQDGSVTTPAVSPLSSQQQQQTPRSSLTQQSSLQGERETGREAGKQASRGSRSPQPNREMQEAAGSQNERSTLNENSAGVAYDPVAKPVFSQHEDLRSQHSQHHQHQQGDPQAFPDHAETYSSPPAAYALAYAQPQQEQQVDSYQSQYQQQQQYSSYMHTIPTGNESDSASYNSCMFASAQQSLYLQAAQEGGGSVPPTDAAVLAFMAESQRMHDSPVWNTGLFGFMLDVPSAVDSLFCPYCISSTHFNVLFREEQGMFVPVAAGLLCIDCCCWLDQSMPLLYLASTLALHTVVIRHQLRKRYNISGNRLIVKSGAGTAQDVTVEGADSAPAPAASADAPATDNASTTRDSDTVVHAVHAASTVPSTTTTTTAAAAAPPRAASTSEKITDFLADVLISFCCTPCAIAQHHREFSMRGEWPGKVVFSQECFCGAREQEPSIVPVTHMF